MLGGHVVKTGLAPVLIDLMRRGIVTHVAMNGSAAIHDYEIARFGATSEDVAAGLKDGTFGMADETGREMNDGLRHRDARRARHGRVPRPSPWSSTTALANPELSLLLAARRLGIPLTVHAALGAEIIHQHPAANGAAIGDTSHRDFRRLAGSLPRLDDGGVVLNLGSAVIMPEVFLKALTIARNLGGGKPDALHQRRPRHAAPLPPAHERRPAPHAAQRKGLRDHGASRDHGAAAGVGGGHGVGRVRRCRTWY